MSVRKPFDLRTCPSFLGSCLPKGLRASLDEIRQRFNHDIKRFSNIETEQTATVDAPLAMALITQAAFKATQKIQRVLDIRCGAGNNTIKLSQYISPFDCDLVDFSLPMQERAQERISEINTGNIKILQGDFRIIDLPEQGYDVILVHKNSCLAAFGAIKRSG